MTHFRRLVVASQNPDKIAEMKAVLSELDLVEEVAREFAWPEIEEIGETLEENALLKARTVMALTGLPTLADDTGLEVAALGGAPGVRTARFAGPYATYEDNVTRLLAALEGASDRSARFRTVIAVAAPDGREWVAEGSLAGAIAHERRGSGGFGYDPVFEVDGRTLSEMGTAEKNRISHRGRAIRAIAEALASG